MKRNQHGQIQFAEELIRRVGNLMQHRQTYHFLRVLAPVILLAAGSVFGSESASKFIGFTNFAGFSRKENVSGEVVWLSGRLQPKISWNELIVSWNAALASPAGMKVEARILRHGAFTKFYTLGLWSDTPAFFPRESVKNQDDTDGAVQTDTLVLKQPGGDVELRITLVGSGAHNSRLKFAGLCFSDTRANPKPLAREQKTYGAPLPVPEYSQMPYPGGEQWCSPTSTSMVLAYWGNKLARPELLRTVPEVAAGVFDKNWPGTGNWPFNTAYAGSFSGMRAFVSRFDSVNEIEEWIQRGLPVVASVSYATLKGKPGNDGHLVVCAGFTPEGNPIINDPGTSQNVRKVFSRENFVKAWACSRNTVYLIFPEGYVLPADHWHHWSVSR